MAAFGRLLDIMDTLREQCPWNAAQTFESGGLVYKQCWSDRTYVYEHAVYVKQREDGFKYKGDIRIPQTVRYGDEDYRVVGVGDNAFKDCKDMTSCVFEGDIEWIGNWAFEGCTGLTELTIPSYYLDDALTCTPSHFRPPDAVE